MQFTLMDHLLSTHDVDLFVSRITVATAMNDFLYHQIYLLSLSPQATADTQFRCKRRLVRRKKLVIVSAETRSTNKSCLPVILCE